MNRLVFLAFAFTAASACAAQVDRVIVRQQWPWSDGILVEYVLSGLDSPVDISVAVTRNGSPVDVPNGAMKGDLHGVTDPVGSFTVDTAMLFGGEKVNIDALRFVLSTGPAAANLDEVLYKIFDLSSGKCEDVTRRQILNGEKGAYETDYSKISPGFSTPLSDVLIWTGVTNNIAYKTTHLVMRKIKATDKVWQSGDPEGVLHVKTSPVARYWVKLTYDYYIGVFETTLAQYKAVYGSYPANCTFGPDGEDTVAANETHYYNVVGYTMSSYSSYNTVVTYEKLCFPTNSYVRDVGRNELCAKMWSKTKCEFTLPTAAEWEFACRAGTDGALYSGEAQTEANVTKLAWHSGVSDNKTNIVGMKLPNAYGLYDMLGNAIERILSSGEMNQGATSGTGASSDDPAVDPLGRLDTTASIVGYSVGGGCRGGTYSNGDWQDCRTSSRRGSYEYSNTDLALGFRFVMPARADGQWADHPAK